MVKAWPQLYHLFAHNKQANRHQKGSFAYVGGRMLAGLVYCLGVQVLAGNYIILRLFPLLPLLLETVTIDALNLDANFP